MSLLVLRTSAYQRVITHQQLKEIQDKTDKEKESQAALMMQRKNMA